MIPVIILGPLAVTIYEALRQDESLSEQPSYTSQRRFCIHYNFEVPPKVPKARNLPTVVNGYVLGIWVLGIVVKGLGKCVVIEYFPLMVTPILSTLSPKPYTLHPKP